MRDFITRHSVAVVVGVYLAFLLAGGLEPREVPVGPVGFVAFCIVTGVVEEAVFCGAVFNLLAGAAVGSAGGVPELVPKNVPADAVEDGSADASANASTSVLTNDEVPVPTDDGAPAPAAPPVKAVLVTAALFGAAHLSLALGLPLALLKVAQAGLFSFVVVALYVQLGRLAVPMALHAAFDCAYFLPAWLATGTTPPYPVPLAPDANLVVLAGTTLFFAICASIIVSRFRKKS